MPADGHRRAHRNDAGLESGALGARSRCQRDVPDLPFVVDDLHRAVGTGKADIGLQLARELELVGLLARPTVVGRSLKRNER